MPRPKGSKNKGIREEVDEIRAMLPAIIPPKTLPVEHRDAAGHIDNIMQAAERELSELHQTGLTHPSHQSFRVWFVAPFTPLTQ
jgi:hypothetical protein